MSEANTIPECTQCCAGIERESDCSCVLIPPPLLVALSLSTSRWLPFCSYRCLHAWLGENLKLCDCSAIVTGHLRGCPNWTPSRGANRRG